MIEENKGLSSQEVLEHQKKYGLNVFYKQKTSVLNLLFRQITTNPLTVILLIATFVSYSLGQRVSSYYIFTMILLSVFLGFWNEFSAQKTVETLLKKISSTVLVIRNGKQEEIPASQITVGDVVFLSEGSIIPADMTLVEVKELEMNESVLTGESQTVYKSLSSKTESLIFAGTSVVSGWGKGIVDAVGNQTRYGKIAGEVAFVKPITDFQKGLLDFGQLVIKVIILITIAIFAVNAFLGHSILESLLFSLAIAVGLTPELLPVIVTISLSHGAGKLAKKHVVAKQLIAIENLGNMDILCTDKTGTLTEGDIHLTDFKTLDGKQSLDILQKVLTFIPPHQHKHSNAIDEALQSYAHSHMITIGENKVIDVEPFSYEKKYSYAVIEEKGKRKIVVRGIPEVLFALSGKNHVPKALIDLQNEGSRVVVVGEKEIGKKENYSDKDLQGIKIIGFVSFVDLPKKTAKQAIAHLHSLGVRVKILTGDSDLVTKKICDEVGLSIEGIITGDDLEKVSKEKFEELIEKNTIFARLTPEQKLLIVQTLQKQGHAVGYMGDGVNDLPTLHGADVGISVNTAVDVAKDAASIVLLRKGLDVVAEGIVEGRKTFQNTLKYILMATSSNFGNMFSAAGASFFLAFLPMTPLQILLTNGLYDFSQTTIPSDNVDKESLKKPRHWDIKFLRDYMIFFGPISSLFDFVTFGIMIFVFHASHALFQTGWFVESVATEILVIFVIRTSRSPFFLSR
ncbi:MAG TPA: magnesium-translocating P-type ATPase, partial [Patescibacteria group bacterium]|nr:magnesium-translocating P-type ATPase [Patescibacteria group bacterium]